MCLNPKTFCRSCCSGFIGPVHEDRRQECKEKCEKAFKAYEDYSVVKMDVFT